MAYSDSEKKYYFPDIIKKVTVAFMGQFKDIRIAKYDLSGNIINYRNVPIVFGSKQALLTKRNKTNQEDFSQYLPRISVVITGMSPTPNKNAGPEILPIFRYKLTDAEYNSIFRPSAYTLEFSVSILSMHLSESNQILEQILPHYNPYKPITIQEFDMVPDFTRDIKVGLTGITADLKDEVTEEEIRKIIWDLNFTVDCFLYKPILFNDIIKSINIELLNTMD